MTTKNTSYTHSDRSALNRAKKDPLASDIVSTPEFKRLKNVSFLGAIDVWLSATKFKKSHNQNLDSNRNNHSIGVYSIAKRIIELDSEFPEIEKSIFLSCALLHDLGHGPLSHSIENVFDRKFKINHHCKTNDLIKDKSKQIYNVLRDHFIFPSDIVLSLDRKIKPYFSKYLNGHFNIDTIDGIYRSFNAIGKVPAYSVDTTIRASMFLLKSDIENTNVLDAFWKMKEQVYNFLIYDGLGRIADEQAQKAVERESNLQPDDFNFTDNELNNKFPLININIINTLTKASSSSSYNHHLDRFRHRYFRIRSKCKPKCFEEICHRYYQDKKDWNYNYKNSFLSESEPEQMMLGL